MGGPIIALVIVLVSVGVVGCQALKGNIRAVEARLTSDPSHQVANQDGRHPPAITTPSNGAQIALAEHLNASGAVVYTAYWCPACRVQKELFGKQAAKALPIVECAQDGYKAQPQLCQEKDIQSYPTWEIDGALLTPGIKEPEELADASGYTGERLFPTLPAQPYSSSGSPQP